MAATTALREALNKGISSGILIDTKIILYSRRGPSGRVSRPKVLYASGHVLKTVPYFNDMLFGNFAESQSKDFNEAIDEDDYTEDYGYLSDSDLEDDEDDKTSSLNPTSKSKVHSSGENKIVCEGHKECVETGKVVKIPDVAFVTFQAFLMYLYTGVVEFAQFGSERNRKSRSAEITNPPEDKVSSSPKSIYRLADKYDVPALKTLALNWICDKFSTCDTVEETFSRFASQYDEIRGLYVEQLAYIWVEDWTGATRARIEEKIDSFIEGDLEYTTETVSALWGVIRKDGDIEAPCTLSAATQVKSPAHWGSVKVALIRSIRTGVFFDRKCWARHFYSREMLKPIYFSSMIMDDKAEKMDRLVKYFIGQNTFTTNLGDNDVESDCEGDLGGLGEETQRAKEDNEEPVRAVFIIGSFSAWKSLFFYRCTEEILFAPLKSQGAHFRLRYIRENTAEGAPLPCSPKSIYVLANLLEIKPLSDDALADIRNKARNSYRVEDDPSLWITTAQENVAKMESELFILNLKDPKLIAIVSGNIKQAISGSSSHLAAALKLGLEMGVASKRRRRSALLECPQCGCTWDSDPASPSFVGSKVFCLNCGDTWSGYNTYMQCASCEHQRTGGYTSCQSCRRRFV